jgi:hypothetical protein
MGFASSWIEERALFPELIHEDPDNHTGIICVVPASNEPGITILFDSLLKCRKPECKTEVIIVINAGYSELGEHFEKNNLTLNKIEGWKRENKDSFFRLYYFIVDTSGFSDWGVGMARKTGMDEALRRFDKINNRNGVILCLDADCTVKENYFEAVYNDFYQVKGREACSLYFEHPLNGDEFPQDIYFNIAQYELHLRYYYQSLLFTGYPWVFHTVGSSMAVKAFQYMKAGGMNRKQAGEDFYFIQKHVSSGSYFYLNTTTVYPSPRISNRVPFGTGASIGKLDESGESQLLTYNTMPFIELRIFFDNTGKFYDCNSSDLGSYYQQFPTGVRSYLPEEEWMQKIHELRDNTSTLDSFRKRFFLWFNMFRIVKYLNHVHSGIYNKVSVTEAASSLLLEIGVKSDSNDAKDLLIRYRELERTRKA